LAQASANTSRADQQLAAVACYKTVGAERAVIATISPRSAILPTTPSTAAATCHRHLLHRKGRCPPAGETDDDYTELSAVAAFGEMAVISGKPHSNTAQAASEVICAA